MKKKKQKNYEMKDLKPRYMRNYLYPKVSVASHEEYESEYFYRDPEMFRTNQER